MPESASNDSLPPGGETLDEVRALPEATLGKALDRLRPKRVATAGTEHIPRRLNGINTA